MAQSADRGNPEQIGQIHPDADQVRKPPAPHKEKPTQAVGVSFFTAAIVAMAFSGFSSFLAYHFATVNQQSTTQVVLVDGAKLANAQMKHTLDKIGLTPAQAQAEGQNFVNELQSALQGYSDAGIIVINSSVAMNAPTGLDVTPKVAQRLGLALE